MKNFAHHMTIDHTKLALELKMAAPSSVTVPKDNSDPSVLDSLKALHGKEFDEAYIEKLGAGIPEGSAGRPERQAEGSRAEGAADRPKASVDGAGTGREEERSVVTT